MAKSAEELQREREALIRILVGTLERRGYTEIRASRLEEYVGNRPPIIYWENTDEGFMPDVVARRDNAYFLFQVELGETVKGRLADRQVELFSAYARHYRRHYCLAVPEAFKGDAREVLLRLQTDERYVHLVGL